MLGALRRKLATALRRRLGFPDQYLALKRLRSAGFKATEVLDVGASYGLFADEVWAFWPESRVHCFEPEPEYVSRLTARGDARLRIIPSLVGSSDLESLQYYHNLGASSVLADTNTALSGVLRTANAVSLDKYCSVNGVRANFLKIDVQGYELEVLRGATSILDGIEVILTEVNHIEIYKNAPMASELIEWIARHGFCLYDICNFMRRPLDNALWQTDMVFVNNKSALCSNKGWN